MDNDEERTVESASKRSGRSRRSNRKNSEVPTFFKQYRIEIAAIFLLISGIFLLVERLEIKALLYHQIVWLSQRIGDMVMYLLSITRIVQKSDIVGLVLIFIALFLILWRMRYRVVSKYKHLDSRAACPNCGDHLRRVPGKVTHRLLEFLFRVRIRRFSCEKCLFCVSRWDLRSSGWDRKK